MPLRSGIRSGGGWLVGNPENSTSCISSEPEKSTYSILARANRPPRPPEDRPTCRPRLQGAARPMPTLDASPGMLLCVIGGMINLDARRVRPHIGPALIPRGRQYQNSVVKTNKRRLRQLHAPQARNTTPLMHLVKPDPRLQGGFDGMTRSHRRIST